MFKKDIILFNTFNTAIFKYTIDSAHNRKFMIQYIYAVFDYAINFSKYLILRMCKITTL